MNEAIRQIDDEVVNRRTIVGSTTKRDETIEMMKTVEMEREKSECLVEFTVGNDTGKILRSAELSKCRKCIDNYLQVTDQTVRLSRSQIRYKVP
jgi:hypothetical protein